MRPPPLEAAARRSSRTRDSVAHARAGAARAPRTRLPASRASNAAQQLFGTCESKIHDQRFELLLESVAPLRGNRDGHTTALASHLPVCLLAALVGVGPDHIDVRRA